MKIQVYKKYYSKISAEEYLEVEKYLEIFKKNNFTKHYEVNEFISNNLLWNEFQNIRSLNKHGEHKGIKGILPKIFAIICTELEISGANGTPLDKAEHY